jgi:hypothetical protein
MTLRNVSPYRWQAACAWTKLGDSKIKVFGCCAELEKGVATIAKSKKVSRRMFFMVEPRVRQRCLFTRDNLPVGSA